MEEIQPNHRLGLINVGTARNSGIHGHNRNLTVAGFGRISFLHNLQAVINGVIGTL